MPEDNPYRHVEEQIKIALDKVNKIEIDLSLKKEEVQKITLLLNQYRGLAGRILDPAGDLCTPEDCGTLVSRMLFKAENI